MTVGRQVHAEMFASTSIIVAGAVLTALAIPTSIPDLTFRVGAYGMGMTLALALLIESRGGWKSFFRTDVVMLLVLYLLTFLEFLFPQEGFDHAISPDGAVSATQQVLAAFACIAIGRHFASSKPTSQPYSREFSPSLLFAFFLLATFFGYLHIFLSVNFDIFEVIQQMMRPRFSQPWTRGKFGDWKALLSEIGAVVFLVPPLAGAIFARARYFNAIQKIIVAIVLLFTLFSGFAGGTRNIFLSYILMFLVSYYLLIPRINLLKLFTVAAPVLVIALAGAFYMIELRTHGLAEYSRDDSRLNTLAIDYNLVNISSLNDVFPRVFPYLGFEVPYISLIRPIPRALWPSKPEGLSTGIEEALGASGLTLSATFVGEMHMAGGTLAVVITALLFGYAAGLWNRLAQMQSSTYERILFASGMFCAALGMRSVMSLFPAMLPTIALWALGRALPRIRALDKQQLAQPVHARR